MKALVYHGPGKKAREKVPDPQIRHPTDGIVKMSATTICGTDLHTLKGDTPEVSPGSVLGHEGVGVHVSPAEFPMNHLWIENNTVTTGLASMDALGRLFKAVA